MASWTRPACRSDEIDSLINSVERYNPANASVLEDYLSQQIRDDTYDPLANLALLKLIQFNESLVTPPDEDDASPDTITLVLAKSLAHAPFGSDFTQCMALLGDRASSTLFSSQEQVAAFSDAAKLHRVLRTRDFPAFWSLLRSEEMDSGPFSPALNALPSFSNLVRLSIGGSIADTFKSIERSRAEQWFSFTSNDEGNLEQFVTEKLGWKEVDGGFAIPSNEANDPRSTVQSETVDLSRMVRTLAQSIQV